MVAVSLETFTPDNILYIRYVDVYDYILLSLYTMMMSFGEHQLTCYNIQVDRKNSTTFFLFKLFRNLHFDMHIDPSYILTVTKKYYVHNIIILRTNNEHNTRRSSANPPYDHPE